MKKRCVPAALLCILFVVAAAACSAPDPGTPGMAAGDREIFVAEGLSMTMVYVPPLTLPAGEDDSGTQTVSRAFQISETEVPYMLWSVVHT